MPGGTASLPHPSAERGRSSVVLSVVSFTRWGELAYKFRLRLNAYVETAPVIASWATLMTCLTRGCEAAPLVPVAGATSEPAGLLNAIASGFGLRNLYGCCRVTPASW